MILIGSGGIICIYLYHGGHGYLTTPTQGHHRLLRKGPESRAQRATNLRTSRLSADSGTLRRRKGGKYVQTTGGQKWLCLKMAHDPI